MFRVENPENLDEVVRNALESLNWKRFIEKDDKVLVKPNFLVSPKVGVTTSLDLVRSLVGILKERTSNVFVGETESIGKNLDKIIEEVDLGCEFVNLSKDKTVVVKGEYGVYRLPELALNSKLVNVPILKTHALTKVTLGVKNLFGLIQDKDKRSYHWKIEGILLDLYRIFKPKLNILDAVYSMDGYGPVSGRVRPTFLLVASNDALTLDLATCRFVGLDPTTVDHLKMIMEHEKNVEYRLVGDLKFGWDFKVPDTRWEKKLAFFQHYWFTRILANRFTLKIMKKLLGLDRKK